MANDNGHHVIPSSVFDRSPLLSELNQNGLMLRDGQLNIISLPNDTEGALASGFAMHNGGDYVHMQYTQMVAGIVREIEGNSLNPISDLLTLQTILRDGLSPQIIAPDFPLGQYLTNNGIPIPNRPAPVFQVNQNDPNPVNLVSPDLNWLGMQQLFPQYFTPFSPLDPGLQAITNGGVPGYAPPIFGTQPEGYTPLDLGIPSGEGLTPHRNRSATRSLRGPEPGYFKHRRLFPADNRHPGVVRDSHGGPFRRADRRPRALAGARPRRRSDTLSIAGWSGRSAAGADSSRRHRRPSCGATKRSSSWRRQPRGSAAN